MTNNNDVELQVLPDLEQHVVIDDPISNTVAVIMIILLQGPPQDQKAVGQFEPDKSSNMVERSPRRSPPDDGQYDEIRCTTIRPVVAVIHFRCMRDRHFLRCPKKKHGQLIRSDWVFRSWLPTRSVQKAGQAQLISGRQNSCNCTADGARITVIFEELFFCQAETVTHGRLRAFLCVSSSVPKSSPLSVTHSNLFAEIFAVFILTSPIFFIFKHSRGHKNLWWVLCQRRHSPQVVKTYLHDAPGWQTQYVGVIAGGHNWSVLILHGIRLTQEPACRRLVNSCTWFDFAFQFSSFNS